jgi:hypothetical protein
MSLSPGIDQIASSFGGELETEAAAAGLDTGQGAGLNVFAQFGLHLGRVVTLLERQQKLQQLEMQAAQYIPDIVFSAPVTANNEFQIISPADSCGPKLGYWWAVQRITVTNANGAAGDFAAIYKGNSLTEFGAQQKQLYTFFGETPLPWHPGRTGLLLAGGRERIICLYGAAAGSGATLVTVSMDVIQVADWALTRFLI